VFQHLKDTDMTYLAHAKRSVGFALKSGYLAITSLVHAVLPCFFVTTFSGTISDISRQLSDDGIKKGEK
jgi:hypothetical protein